MMGTAVVAVCAGLAFANGANDVSKGVATLVGSGVTDYRRAVAWGTLWTGAGVVAPDADAHFVYKRDGLPCRACGTPVGMTEIGARKLYWCPGCQV